MFQKKSITLRPKKHFLDMIYPFVMGQDELARVYESAHERMAYNPDFAEHHKNVLHDHAHFNSEKEALQAAIAMKNKNHSNCQIWAKIEKDGDIYKIVDFWIVTDRGEIKQSAEYIGLALMYDDSRLQQIIDENVNIEEVVAYW